MLPSTLLYITLEVSPVCCSNLGLHNLAPLHLGILSLERLVEVEKLLPPSWNSLSCKNHCCRCKFLAFSERFHPVFGGSRVIVGLRQLVLSNVGSRNTILQMQLGFFISFEEAFLLQKFRTSCTCMMNASFEPLLKTAWQTTVPSCRVTLNFLVLVLLYDTPTGY